MLLAGVTPLHAWRREHGYRSLPCLGGIHHRHGSHVFLFFCPGGFGGEGLFFFEGDGGGKPPLGPGSLRGDFVTFFFGVVLLGVGRLLLWVYFLDGVGPGLRWAQGIFREPIMNSGFPATGRGWQTPPPQPTVRFAIPSLATGLRAGGGYSPSLICMGELRPKGRPETSAIRPTHLAAEPPWPCDRRRENACNDLRKNPPPFKSCHRNRFTTNKKRRQ